MTKSSVLFFCFDSHGHVNPSIAIGQSLVRRGHRVIFAIDYAWREKLIKEEFEQQLYGTENNNTEYWPQLMQQLAPVFRLPVIQVMEKFQTAAIMKCIKNNMMYDLQFKAIINRINPDIIITDFPFCSPSLINSGIPWIYIHCLNPLFHFFDKRAPPSCSGLPIIGPKKEWDYFQSAKDNMFKTICEELNNWVMSQGISLLENGQFQSNSPYLNLYIYPEELDYIHLRPMPPKFFRIDCAIRSDKENFQISDVLKNKAGKLIYVSMGTIASSDLSIMKHLIDILKDSPHRFIFSKGPRSDEYELSDNMWGAASVPQTNVIPLMDLVITHGGNNSVTETFFYDKPMIVLPFFCDQFDNAQRIHETGYGIRLDTYNCTKEQLLGSIEKLLNDKELEKRLKIASQRIQKYQSVEKAVDLIEKITKKINC